jgi:ABC-type glutathione transport system ATPase component
MKLEIRDLAVRFGERPVVDIGALQLDQGEILGLAGESGAGKSITGLAILGLAGTVGATVSGSIKLDGMELVGAPEPTLQDLRGRRVAMIFQSPALAFNPVVRVGDLFVRTLRLHGIGSASQRRERARAALREVLLTPDLLHRYPSQLSGGQLQRVAIALALALRSEVLIADEPTSALDVTVQGEILDILRLLRDRERMAVLLISHDLAVMAELCNRVAIMKAGSIVEEGAAAEVLGRPRHPYTKELLAAVPTLERTA